MKEQKTPTIIHTHSTTWHDGSAALLTSDKKIVNIAAERIDRYKHSWDSGAAYRYLESLFPNEEFGGAYDKSVDISNGLEDNGHHLYHAASTFFASPFSQAAVLIVDGQGPDFGKRASTSLWVGEGNSLTLLEAPYLNDGKFAPQSIGHFYTAIGALSGMKSLHEEGKTMGLAPYGKPSKYLTFFEQYAYSNPDGSYFIDPDFIYAMLGNTFGPSEYNWEPQPAHIQAIWNEFIALRGRELRRPSEDVSSEDMDIAFAGQEILERIMLGLARRAKELTGSDYLCLAGGVALNSVTNGKILRSQLFKDIYIFPAAGDDGQAVGKLLLDIKNQGLDIDTRIDTAYLGPVYDESRLREALDQVADQVIDVVFSDSNLYREVAKRIAQGKVIGWFNGGSEIGPRALGHRSILADPRDPNMRDYINFEVKHREWYRPLAPVILENLASDYFDIDRPSPFMLLVAEVLANKQDFIPAVTHVDGTARVQTINESQDQRYYNLVKEFGRQTGVPVLLNTSFNDKGEPIVETPEHALNSFLSMKLDALVMGKHLILKKANYSPSVVSLKSNHTEHNERYVLSLTQGSHSLYFSGKLANQGGQIIFTPYGQTQGQLPMTLLNNDMQLENLASDELANLKKWFGVLLGAYNDQNFERLYVLFPELMPKKL